MDQEVQRKINQAKIALMHAPNTLFFSALLTHMKLVIEDDCPTAWTDGISMGFGTEFVKKCTPEELIGVFMHELGHVIFEHVEIALENKLIHDVHNIAGDHYINLWLYSMGYQLPHFIEPYADPKYSGWSTQQIYVDLCANPPPPPPPNGMGMDIRMPKGMSKAEHKERVIGNIVKATMQAEMGREAGSIPGHIKRVVEEVLAPKLPWQTILANYMSAYARDDYSMRRPNKKYMPEFHIPGLYSEAMEHVVVAKDVSGSISSSELNDVDAEERYFWETMKPASLRSMTFDTEVHMDKIYVQGDEIPISVLEGGGGTDVTPVLQYVLDEDPKITLIFTDGGFTMPEDLLEQVSNNDIFWIIKGMPNFTATHGTVILMD